MAANGYLQSDYEFDVNMLVDPIRKATLARKIATIQTVLGISQDTVKLDTVAESFAINIESDPVNVPKSAVGLTRATYHVPVLDTMLGYGVDELQRINSSKLPYNGRVARAGTDFAKYEDIMLLGASVLQDGVASADYTPLAASGNYTAASTELNVSTYALGVSTLAGLIKQLITSYGNIKGYDLNLIMTPDVYGTALGVLNTNGDRHLIDEMVAMLQNAGSANSNIYVSHYLGGSMSKGTDGRIDITTGSTNAMLLLNNPIVFGVLASPFAQRLSVDNIDGVKVVLLERYFPFVFKTSGIIYSATVVLS